MFEHFKNNPRQNVKLFMKNDFKDLEELPNINLESYKYMVEIMKRFKLPIKRNFTDDEFIDDYKGDLDVEHLL